MAVASSLGDAGSVHFQSAQELSKFKSRTSLPAVINRIMTAALVAVRHHMHAEGKNTIEVSEECPTKGIIKQGVLARQCITASATGFAERHIDMTADHVYFSRRGRARSWITSCSQKSSVFIA